MPEIPADAPYSGTDIYCDQIIPGLRPVQKVAETELALAFHHTRPYWPVHIIVIPKVHIHSLLALDDAEHQAVLADMVKMLQQVASQVIAQHGAAAITTNLGDYQDSKHLHWHVHFGAPLS
jgi:histidine triad (HIT) family protein